jgi:hypothetical protein
MTILCNSGLGWPIGRVQALMQAWAFESMISLDYAGDLRWAIVALLSNAVAAAGNALVESILRRASQGARFAQRMTAADTMVAAAGR